MHTRQTYTLLQLKLLGIVFICSSVISSSTQAADFFNGEKIYQKYCQSCHGIKGQGGIGGAPNFARGRSLMKPDAYLYDTINSGKNAMPAYRGVLKEEEFYDVITYLRSFY
jgi:mono/diheme cytochrome c family protein